MRERQWREHYNRTASTYDWKERLWGLLLGYSDSDDRRRLVSRLELRAGQRVLEVSVGTGTNLVFAAEGPGRECKMVGADISIGMLRQCQRKLARHGLPVDLIESDAAHLPFPDAVFDAVLHFGAITLFGDRKKAIDEMVRVAKPGARIVIGDVGMSPDSRHSLRARLALRVNPRHGQQPPMDLIAPQANAPRLTWFRNDTCYFIDFAKAKGRVP